jgi:DnaJ-class molecular chaperone
VNSLKASKFAVLIARLATVNANLSTNSLKLDKTEMADYYKILEVSKDASHEEIQSAYRKLARKYHPDMNQNDPKGSKEKFQKVQEAYEVIGNPEKRRIYDQFGVAPDQMGAGGGQGPFQWSFGSNAPFNAGGFGSLEEFLNSLFTNSDGMRPRQTRRTKNGVDVNDELSVPFDVSINGGNVEKKIRRQNATKDEIISIKIQPGTDNGTKIRIPGFGKPGQNGGNAGNLILTVKVEEHKLFKRDGLDLYLTVPITLNEAVFGGNAEIPTPKGNITIKIPKGSNSGKKLRVKGYGITNQKTKKNNTGDLYAVFSIVIPEKWNEEDENLIKKLKSEIKNPRENLKL